MNFPVTRWSVLAVASLNGDTTSTRALDELCRNYWQPVNGFIRLRGFREMEAEDLTQTFLTHLCEHSVWRKAVAEQGRFRSFLLGALHHFLADELDRRNAQKRGSGAEHVEFNEESIPNATDPGAEAQFDRAWALSILERAFNSVRDEFAAEDKSAVFLVLKNFLPGAREPLSLEDAAAKLQLPLPTLKTHVHRLRARFRDRVREQVAATVSAPHEVAEEWAHLQRVLMDRGNDFTPRES